MKPSHPENSLKIINTPSCLSVNVHVQAVSILVVHCKSSAQSSALEDPEYL